MPGDYAGSPGSLATAIGVSQSVGYAALTQPNVRIAGTPGFGAGPIYTFDGGPHIGWITYSFGPAAAEAPAATAASTGVNPTETSYALYGHIIPLSVFGGDGGRIGGDIISGPFVENGNATFCISFGVPADPYGTRTLKEIAFDSEVVWENGSFNTEAFTFRFYPGTLTQAVDPIETTHWGADAVAYRPQLLLWFENLPLANTKFNKIPYVAAVIADSTTGDDQVNLGEAFTRLATSPWVGYSSAQFETVGVTDSCGGLIIAQDAEFLGTIQQFTRFYRNWNILQIDKLRIVDRGAATTADISLDRTTLMGGIVFARGAQDEIPRELELSTIDPGADYTIVPSKAVRPREPVNVSASVKTESVYLPMIMDTFTRQSLVTYTKYQEEIARKKVTGTAMLYGLEIEPGDLVAITGLGDDFRDTTFRIIETVHGANHSVEFTAEAFLNCEVGDFYWAGVVLLMGFEDVDGSTGAPGMTDESSRHHGTATAYSGAQTDTAVFKFGTSSLKLLGTGPESYISFPDSDDWLLSSANSDQFTVEAWVQFNTLTLSGYLIVGHYFSSGNYSWGFGTRYPDELFFKLSTNGSSWTTDFVSSGAALVTGVWYHLAVDKDSSGKIRLYRNGVMVGSNTPVNSAMFNVASYPLVIGNSPALLDEQPIDGFMDELRITKGICRYGSDGGFAVPTSAYPRHA